jgi:sec-independent protein translocase protein TatB
MAIVPPIQIASLGMSDSLFLMLLALVVFGPRKLPQIGRQIGKLMYEFRKASNDFKFQMEEEMRNAEEAERRKKEEAERQKALTAGTPAPAPRPFEGGYMNAPAEEPAKTPGETEGLRIQPPSTGEQIPSAHPTRMVQESEPAAQPDVTTAAAHTPEAPEAKNGSALNAANEPDPQAVGATGEQDTSHG